MIYPNDCNHREEEFNGTVEIEGKKYDKIHFLHDGPLLCISAFRGYCGVWEPTESCFLFHA